MTSDKVVQRTVSLLQKTHSLNPPNSLIYGTTCLDVAAVVVITRQSVCYPPRLLKTPVAMELNLRNPPRPHLPRNPEAVGISEDGLPSTQDVRQTCSYTGKLKPDHFCWMIVTK